MKIRQIFFIVMVCLINKPAFAKSAPWIGADLKGLTCTGQSQGYGPYDYTDWGDTHNKVGGGGDTALSLVEKGHFPSTSANLIKPVGRGFAGDFDYTLRAFPNHHRALLSLIRFQLQVNKKLRSGEKLFSPVECYFQRAINFSPKDSTTYVLYAYYLHKIGHIDQSDKLYETALKISPESPKVKYSYGLFLVDTKNYDKALQIAQDLYKKHKAPNNLKNKLIQLKIWQEP